MDQEVIKIPSARLCLTAMTLRGIGPYGTGARLELRPITILCGTNGGGKSTWIKALRTLKSAVESPWFPIKLSDSPDFFYQGERGLDTPLIDPESDKAYGVFGTLGIELQVSANCTLETNSPVSTSTQQLSNAMGDLFYGGKLSKGDKISLRLGDAFSIDWSAANCEFPLVLSSLWLNGELLGRVMLHAEKSEVSNVRVLWCEVELSPAVLSFSDAGPDPVCVARIRLEGDNPSFQADEEIDEGSALGHAFFDLVKALGREVMGGFFSLRSVREEQAFSNDGEGIATRYVGQNGQDALRQLMFFYDNGLLYTGPKIDDHDFTFTPQFINGATILSAIENGLKLPVDAWRPRLLTAASRGLDLLNQIVKSPSFEKMENDAVALWRVADADAKNIVKEIRHDSPEPSSPGFISYVYLLNQELSQHAAKALDVLFEMGLNDEWAMELARVRMPKLELPTGVRSSIATQFYDRIVLYNLISHAFSGYRPVAIATGSTLDDWNALLKTTRFDEDTPPGVVALSFIQGQACPPWSPNGTPHTVGQATRDWIYSLLGYVANLDFPDGVNDDPMTGIMLDDHPSRISGDAPQGWASIITPHHGTADLSLLSTGFHQVFPIVVQPLLMKPYELFAVENPEVHLHPKLQVKVTEFLLKEAAEQKFILIETHSDLVVRRLIRAMIDEEIDQESIRIYFASLVGKPEYMNLGSNLVSKLEALEVDNMGRIKNWPEGFMDEDIRESRRLLDIMYHDPTVGD